MHQKRQAQLKKQYDGPKWMHKLDVTKVLDYEKYKSDESRKEKRTKHSGQLAVALSSGS